jgi:hypothetical protein
VKVEELTPGDLVTNGPMQAVFVARCPHPLFDGLQLVIWRMLGAPIVWSHDALSLRQEVGEAVDATPEQRTVRLRAALLGASNG